MDKRLEIAGTGKVWIVKKCIECHLLDSDACCVIDNKHRPKFDEECENCPLPDAKPKPKYGWPDDDDHKLGPNREKLIAVSVFNPRGRCSQCFYGKTAFTKCPLRTLGDLRCESSYRKDAKAAVWELAGERK